jgi:hypothetical protein
MQAYLPGAGWVDFDPTNSIVGNRNLIRVAVAWDQRNACSTGYADPFLPELVIMTHAQGSWCTHHPGDS